MGRVSEQLCGAELPARVTPQQLHCQKNIRFGHLVVLNQETDTASHRGFHVHIFKGMVMSVAMSLYIPTAMCSCSLQHTKIILTSILYTTCIWSLIQLHLSQPSFPFHIASDVLFSKLRSQPTLS